VLSRKRFNRVPEKIPEKIPENIPKKNPVKVWEALVQMQVKFNRVLKNFRRSFWEILVQI
jgi:hypothetical protein